MRASHGALAVTGAVVVVTWVTEVVVEAAATVEEAAFLPTRGGEQLDDGSYPRVLRFGTRVLRFGTASVGKTSSRFRTTSFMRSVRSHDGCRTAGHPTFSKKTLRGIEEEEEERRRAVRA